MSATTTNPPAQAGAPADAPAAAPAAFRRASRGFWHTVGRRLSRDPITMACAVILLLIVVSAIAAPWLGLDNPFAQSMARRLKPFGYQGHWLGTDELGRDMLSRLVFGGRMSLFTGFFPVALATLIGGTLGVVAGYAGGRTNMIIMRCIDVFYAFPSVLLAVAISGFLGAGQLNGLVSLTLIFVPPVARIAESVTTRVRSEDFVEAARATGAPTSSILSVHIVPNVLGPILVYASSLISVSIVLASGLSFLGLGVTPPNAEWGLMLSTLRQAIYVAPVTAILPGAMIFITSMCFSLMSDGLRNAMDVKV